MEEIVYCLIFADVALDGLIPSARHVNLCILK